MSSSVELLLSVASSALSTDPAASLTPMLRRAGKRGRELFELLATRNGFYAFESALHVFPLSGSGDQSLDRWNSLELWRNRYEDLTEGCLFFAEDIFGGQFCIRDDKIHAFDPETGALESLAPTLEGWAHTILKDYRVLTGQPLAHEWQSRHGALPLGTRLLPKQPFVAGGMYEIDNLYALDAVKGMLFRADLAIQIRNIPNGATIELNVVE